MVSIIGQKAHHILEAVIEGKLQAFTSEEELPIPKLGTLQFEKYDVNEYIEVVQSENGWVDREYVAKAFGVKVTMVLRWIEADLVRPAVKYANKHYFSRRSIDQFREDYIFTEKAAELLHVTPLTIQKWVRKGRLDAVAGPGIDECHRYLFDKRQLLKWRDSQFITAPELAKQLGMSHSQILLWVKQGKIFPVSGPGVDQCGRYLFIPQELVDD